MAVTVIREIKLDPTQNVSEVFVDGDPSDLGLDRGIGSLATVIGGALGGNQYRKDDTADDAWTLILDANPS